MVPKFSFSALLLFVTGVAISLRVVQLTGASEISFDWRWIEFPLHVLLVACTTVDVVRVVCQKLEFSTVFIASVRLAGALLIVYSWFPQLKFEDQFGFPIDVVAITALQWHAMNLGVLFCLMPVGSTSQSNPYENWLFRVAMTLFVFVQIAPFYQWMVTQPLITNNPADWYNAYSILFAMLFGGVLLWIGEGIASRWVMIPVYSKVPPWIQVSVVGCLLVKGMVFVLLLTGAFSSANFSLEFRLSYGLLNLQLITRVIVLGIIISVASNPAVLEWVKTKIGIRLCLFFVLSWVFCRILPQGRVGLAIWTFASLVCLLPLIQYWFTVGWKAVQVLMRRVSRRQLVLLGCAFVVSFYICTTYVPVSRRIQRAYWYLTNKKVDSPPVSDVTFEPSPNDKDGCIVSYH